MDFFRSQNNYTKTDVLSFTSRKYYEIETKKTISFTIAAKYSIY